MPFLLKDRCHECVCVSHAVWTLQAHFVHEELPDTHTHTFAPKTLLISSPSFVVLSVVAGIKQPIRNGQVCVSVSESLCQSCFILYVYRSEMTF